MDAAVPKWAPQSLARAALAAVLATMVLGQGARADRSAVPQGAGSASAARLAGDGYHLTGELRSDRPPAPGGVIDPVDIDVAPDGTIFVLDRALRRAQRFSAEGQVLTVYGGPGDGEGKLAFPLGLAVDLDSDRVYVADTGHRRLAVFRLDGTWVASWEGFGRPESITIGVDGRVYVYDRDRNAILVRKTDGSQSVNFPVQVAISTVAELPRGLATGPDGTIFFAAENPVANHPNIVYAFSPGGETLRPRTAVEYQIRDIAFDAGGRMFLLDGTNAKLVTDFNRDTGAGTSVAVKRNVRAMAASGDGQVYLLDPTTTEQLGGITVLRWSGRSVTPVREWRFPSLELGWFYHPLSIATGADGDFYLVDEMRRVQRYWAGSQVAGQFARNGLQLATATTEGDLIIVRTRSASGIDDPQDPDVAPPGTRRIRIERYAFPGGVPAEVEKTWDARPVWSYDTSEPLDDVPGTFIAAIEHDAATGRTYALDIGKKRVLVLDRAGTLTATWPLADPGGVPAFIDLALGPGGTPWVLHSGAHKVYPLAADGSMGAPIDIPERSARIAVGFDGSIFGITGERWVWKLGPGRGQTVSWSLPAARNGTAGAPSDLTVRPDGRVYVADFEGHAIYVFSAGAPPPIYLPVAYGDAPARSVAAARAGPVRYNGRQ